MKKSRSKDRRWCRYTAESAVAPPNVTSLASRALATASSARSCHGLSSGGAPAFAPLFDPDFKQPSRFARQLELGQGPGDCVDREAVKLPPEAGLDQLLQHFPNALGIVPVHVYPNATAIAGKDLESPAPNSHTRELRQGSRSCHQGDAARDRRRSASPSVLAQRHLVDQLGDRQVELAGLADLPAAHADDEAAGVGESRGLSPGRRRAASGACPRSSRRRPSARAPRGPASRRCRRPSRPRRRPPGTRRRAAPRR